MRAIARSEESLSGGEEGEMEKQGVVDDWLLFSPCTGRKMRSQKKKK